MDGALTEAALADGDVLKSGWLTKKGGLRPSWNRRFFRAAAAAADGAGNG